jgi:predicted ABC-type ATPase
LPSLIIIGGPNGSGKTTLTKYLVQKGRIKSPVINPDEIASEELGGYQYHIGAAKIALERRKTAIDQNQDIAFETTFSGQSELTELKTAKKHSYHVTLYYVALQSPLDNIIRVQERQSNRGHNVDNEDIIRRYEKSKLNLLARISLFDKVYLFDNTGSMRSRVAIFERGKLRWLNPKHKQHPFFKELF